MPLSLRSFRFSAVRFLRLPGEVPVPPCHHGRHGIWLLHFLQSDGSGLKGGRALTKVGPKSISSKAEGCRHAGKFRHQRTANVLSPLPPGAKPSADSWAGGEIGAPGGVGGGAPARFSRTALPSPCAFPRCFKKVAPLFGPACQEQEPSERGFFQGWPQPPACMASAGLTRLATVVTQERGQLVHRFFQNGDARQVDDTEVVGLFPVET